MNRIAIAILLLVLLVYSTAFTVNERELAIKFQFGEIVKSDYEPGLHFKLPFVQNVRKFERRVMSFDNSEERFLTGDEVNMLVDFFVKWRITDVDEYYRATSGREDNAASRLLSIIKDGLRREFGNRSLLEVVSTERNQMMEVVRLQAGQVAAEIGIEVVDVRVRRIDLENEVMEDVYRSMRSERLREATRLRAEGDEEAQRIRAEAERQRTVILADAFREAEETRGAGDARAADIYATAYERDREFYAFYRSLEAYRRSVGLRGDVMVLDTDDEFFQYLRSAGGG